MSSAEKREVAICELLDVAADPDELLDAVTDYAMSICAARIRAAAEEIDGPARAALLGVARKLEE